MATGLRGATRRPSINDGRNERNAQLVKTRKRSGQLSKIATDAMSQADPVGSALAASDKARDIARTEIDAGVAKDMPLRSSIASGQSSRLDVSRQVRVYVELYDIDAQRVVHTSEYLDYIDPIFEDEKISFPTEIAIKEDKIPRFAGLKLANKGELNKTEHVTEAGGSEDHEFETNFVISVFKDKNAEPEREAPATVNDATVSSSGVESKTITRTIKFVDDSGRTVAQSRDAFTFKGVRKGESVSWSDESHEFGAVSVIDNDEFVVETPGEKKVVTPDSPSEILTEVKVLPKRVLDTVSSDVSVSAFINAHGSIFKQEPVKVSVAFQKFRSDDHEDFDVFDPAGTIERAVRNAYRGSEFSVKNVSVDVSGMSARVELGIPTVNGGNDAVSTQREAHASSPAKEQSTRSGQVIDVKMSDLASRFGASFKSAIVADDFVDPSELELDALHETHVDVTEALAQALNESRENAGLNPVKPRALEHSDALSLYEWAADASLKKRTSKSRVLNNVIRKLDAEYESELLMNTRAVRSTCNENDIANQLMGSVRQAERAGSPSALMAENANYVTVAVLVSNVSDDGSAMHLSASVVMTR